MEKKLKELITEILKLNGNEVTDSLTMKDTDAWDSSKHMELVVSIEHALGIELNFEEIVAMQTFKDIKRIVAAKGV